MPDAMNGIRPCPHANKRIFGEQTDVLWFIASCGNLIEQMTPICRWNRKFFGYHATSGVASHQSAGHQSAGKLLRWGTPASWGRIVGMMRGLPCQGTIGVRTWQNSPCVPEMPVDPWGGCVVSAASGVRTGRVPRWSSWSRDDGAVMAGQRRSTA